MKECTVCPSFDVAGALWHLDLRPAPRVQRHPSLATPVDAYHVRFARLGPKPIYTIAYEATIGLYVGMVLDN